MRNILFYNKCFWQLFILFFIVLSVTACNNNCLLPRMVAQTCANCGSIRIVQERLFSPPKIKIKYKSNIFLTCSHKWEEGMSFAHPALVKNGKVVLIRENNKYAAVILRKQAFSPDETVEYDWWYNPDSSSVFSKSSQGILAGHSAGKTIAFGPFCIGWSAHTDSEGYIYLNHSAGDSADDKELHICVTDEVDIYHINAADKKWKYYSTPAY